MLAAHRIQLLPNNKHRAYFARAAGVARFCFNWALAEWQRQYEAGEKPNALALKKQFNAIQAEQFPWVGEVTSYAKQQAFADVGTAFQNFFRRVKQGEKPGYPRFKKKGKSRDSFYLPNTSLKFDRNRVHIQKLGWVRMREQLRFSGKVMGARVSREADRWYIAIQVDTAQPALIHTGKEQSSVGIDLGVNALATLSDGTQVTGPKAFKASKRRLKRLQRQLRPAKRQRGSARYRRYQLQVQRLHRRISGIRRNALHQLSAQVTNRYSLIALEDLNVKGMSSSARGDVEAPGKNVRQKSGLNRNILDMGFYELRRQIEYKAAKKGAQVVFIDRWAPSSKTCSGCGTLKAALSLKDRTFNCDACGLSLDRDYNAALNIEQLGLVTLSGPTGGAPGC